MPIGKAYEYNMCPMAYLVHNKAANSTIDKLHTRAVNSVIDNLQNNVHTAYCPVVVRGNCYYLVEDETR